MVLATKFGCGINPDGTRYDLANRPEHIRSGVDAMLNRLRTDQIELLHQHRVHPNVSIKGVAGTGEEVIQQGKVVGGV